MSSLTLLTNLRQIAAQAVDQTRVFTNLAHLIDMDLLREAFRLTRKDGTPGVDGVTGWEYARNLESNLKDLYERLRTCRYRATPVLRSSLPKDDGGRRPLGIPIFEDKIVQRAVVMLLTPIYEQVFYGFSYAYREGKRAHQAVSLLREVSMRFGGGWVVDADIRGFFDNLDHGVLRDLVGRRVKDGGIHRLLGKWLNVGVLDGDDLINPETGTPQGGVISPLLANIYLHYVLDEWFVKVVQPRLRGRSQLVRFADDFIILCDLKEDALRILEVLPKRLGKYGLELHPEKTRLIQFRKPSAAAKSPKANGNGTFDFVGFTFYWARSRRGAWVVKKKTRGDRLRRAKRRVMQWCKDHRHMKVELQHATLVRKLQGHYNYYAVRCNYEALWSLYQHTRTVWCKWLRRRSQKSKIKWENFAERIEAEFPLPVPRIIHTHV